MAVVLGIDAAWTLAEPSGVALLDTRVDAKCLAVAPSYAAFLNLAKGVPVVWSARHRGQEPPVGELLEAASQIAGTPVDVVAIDMPISKLPIESRRVADNAVSLEFGGRWCSTHTPSSLRPGPMGARITEAFVARGYSVATTSTPIGRPMQLLEVYPHTALLSLLKRERRVPYKISKLRSYWKSETPEVRRTLLFQELQCIESGLVSVLGPLPIEWPAPSAKPGALKAFEDALDAMISAWVGILFLEGRAVPLGDESAAVWCPHDVVRRSIQRGTEQG